METLLNVTESSVATPYDVSPRVSATLADLDRVLFENIYLPAAFAPDVLEANERTFEQRLAVTKMVDAANTAVPTVLGLLVLGKAPRDFLPGAYIQFLRIGGRELGDPVVDELAVDGPVPELLKGIDHKLQSHNRTSVDITSGPREARHSDYPVAALQQLVRNAVMHRSYEATHAPVRVYWYDDR